MAVKWEGVTELVSRMETVAAKLKTYESDVVTLMAEQGRKIILANAEHDAPGLKLAQFNRGKGVHLGAAIVKGKVDGVSAASVWPIPPGPWYLLNEGSYRKPSGFPIGVRVRGAGGRRGQRNQSGFLGNAARGFAAIGPVTHTPIHAKHTWAKGADEAMLAGDALFKGAVSVRTYEIVRGGVI